MKVLFRLCMLALIAVALIACDGQAEPTPTKTPRPTDTATPLPTLEQIALPAIESNADQVQPTDTPLAGSATVSPIETPTATPVPPTPTPGLEAQAPVPVLAANLSCGDGCNAGNPEGMGLAILDPTSGQFLIWTDKLEALTGEEYEGWLVRDGVVESSGRFNAEPSGVTSSFGVLSDAVKSQPWTSFVLTIEPDPDDSDAPAAPHSIGGSLRSTVMGEAIYSRFNMPCQECHGAQAEGGSAAVLLNTSLPYAEFEAAVRAQHPDADYSEGVIAGRDLQHIYAWLIAPR